MKNINGDNIYRDWSDLQLAKKYFISESKDEKDNIITELRTRLKLKSYQSNDIVEYRIKEILLKAKLSKPEHDDIIYGLSVLNIVILVVMITIVILMAFFKYTFSGSLIGFIVATYLLIEYIYSCFSGIVRGKIMNCNKVENPLSFEIWRNIYLIVSLFFYVYAFVKL